MIELTRLRVFQAAARAESFTVAAGELGFSQPAVSHQIAQLEREVGTPLFERQARRLQLTEAGRTLLAHVDAILLKVADAEREVAEAASLGTRRLRVGVFTSAAISLVPLAAGEFRRALPAVELEFTEGDPVTTLPGLAAGAFDVVLVYDYPMVSAPMPDTLDIEPLFVDQLAVALPAGHRLAAGTTVALTDLAGELWCAPHHTVCRDALEQGCSIAGFAPQVVSETNDYSMMQGLVAAGVGVAVIPRLALGGGARAGVELRRLAGTNLERVTFLATRKGAARSVVHDRFRAALLASLGAMSTPDFPLEPFDPATSQQRAAPARGDLHRAPSRGRAGAERARGADSRV